MINNLPKTELKMFLFSEFYHIFKKKKKFFFNYHNKLSSPETGINPKYKLLS